MVRARAMSSKPRGLEPRRGPGGVLDLRRPWAPSGEPTSPDRLEMLLARSPQGMDSTVGRDASRVAAHIVARRRHATKPSVGADGDRHTILARCLLDDAEVHGGDVDPRRALAPEALWDYLDRVGAGRTESTRNKWASDLVGYGRYVHPELYPKAAAPYISKPAGRRVPSERDVQRLYGIAHLVGGVVGARFGVMLDLGTHVGTTAAEARAIVGEDIRPHGRIAVATVRAVTSDRRRNVCADRRVPIADPRTARRLLDTARAAGPNPIIATTGKNALSDVPCALRQRGHEVYITMDQLRDVWIRRLLTEPIPTRAIWQIAGLSVSDGLRWHIPHCPPLSDAEIIHYMCREGVA